MKLITKLDQIAATAPCSLALGTFDGLHRGHMAVIHAAAAPGPGLEYWEPAVFTFESSPSGVCSVVTPRDKERLLETAGIRLSLIHIGRLATRARTPALPPS